MSTYRGGLEGYAATAPVASGRFEAARPEVAGYRSYLLREQAELFAEIGSPRRLYAYTTALNGFAAALTASQVKQLRSRPTWTRWSSNAKRTSTQCQRPGTRC